MDWAKLKAFSEVKFNVAKLIVSDRLENTVGKEVNAGCQHIPHNVFQTLAFQVAQSRDYVVKS